MKLSQLIAYRNKLKTYNVGEIKRAVSQSLNKIQYEVTSTPIQVGDFSEQITESINDVGAAVNKVNEKISELLENLDEMISIAEHPYFVESYRLYDQEMCFESNEYILSRNMPMTSDTKNMITARIKSYADWKYPGMIIRPGQEDFVKEMVSFDPLYLIDREYGLLVPAIEKFTPEYQKRLRTYSIREGVNDPILDKIPNGQFGFCLAFNFFEFKPFEILKIYLHEIYQKLRPGGTLAMTFNDCDREHCVALTESNFTCYTPGRMVLELAKSIGYTQTFQWYDNCNLTWLELKKPGQLDSIRGGQTLAKIISKSVAKSK